jgi:N-acetylmuramoyl-L-alanine amidase
MPRIYISPSSQEQNIGTGSFGTEEEEMNKIADALMSLLAKDGRFEAKRNTPDMDVYQMAADSNQFNADIHVAIHSNAGGGAGTEVFAYGSHTNSERLAQALYAQVAPLSPGSDRGVKYNPGLVEVGDRVAGTSALIELGFHDNAADAGWMVQGKTAIAAALYRGVCDFYSYAYQALDGCIPDTSPATDHDIYLCVRVLQSKSEGLISQILELGYACKVLTLA